jgi:anionic cell wall polymer biosynthesis LytR-Cps2A-Psr (LCP) family protein
MKRSDNSFKSIILLFIIIFLVLASVVTAYFIFRSDHIEELIKNKQNINILFSFSKDEKSFMIELFLYNSITNKGAIIYIPGNLWTKSDASNPYDEIENTYNPTNLQPLIKRIEKITNLEIPFFIDIQFDNITKFIDLLGGITIENRATLENEIHGNKVLFKKGNILLDGERVKDYLSFKKDDESAAQEDQRKQQFLKSLLTKFADKQINEILKKPDAHHYLQSIINTNLSSKELTSLIDELKKLRTKNIISRRVRGIEKTNNEGNTVLFPLEEGEYLKFTIQHTLDVLANQEILTEEDLTVKLEILNGTEINKLAQNTAYLFRKYGYHIEFYGNADKHDYESTAVIDRKGNMEIARRVADFIKCKNVITKTDQELNTQIDVTIILGKDFDGQYCK